MSGRRLGNLQLVLPLIEARSELSQVPARLIAGVSDEFASIEVTELTTRSNADANDDIALDLATRLFKLLAIVATSLRLEGSHSASRATLP